MANQVDNHHLESHEELVPEESIELNETDMVRIRNLARSLHSFKEVSEAVKRVIQARHFIEPWNVNYCSIELEKKAEEVALRSAMESGRPPLESSPSFTDDLPDSIRQGVEANDCMDLANTNCCSNGADQHVL